jgi:hypothetical protein
MGSSKIKKPTQPTAQPQLQNNAFSQTSGLDNAPLMAGVYNSPLPAETAPPPLTTGMSNPMGQGMQEPSLPANPRPQDHMLMARAAMLKGMATGQTGDANNPKIQNVVRPFQRGYRPMFFR